MTLLINLQTKWVWNGYWTPRGVVFDVGIATKKALDKLNDEFVRPDFAGGYDEYSNGNGSLMRILPLAFYLNGKSFEDRIMSITQVSSITHRHQMSIIACVIYIEIAIHLINGLDLKSSIKEMKTAISSYYSGNKEIERFHRILKEDIALYEAGDIHSSGYVVHTLEASLWSLLTSNSYIEAVLKSINLGEDTDTTGAVTGGLAGLCYGLQDVPIEWIDQLARIGEITALCNRFREVVG